MKKKVIATSLLALIALTTSAQEKIQNIAVGKDKAAVCSGCHGSDGIGLGDEFPNLAGQKYGYLVKQLTAFKTGTRNDPTMNAMAASLSEQDMADIASYFSQLSPVASTINLSSGNANDSVSLLNFPEPVYVSMKGSAQIAQLPSQQVAPGGPNMLYTALSPDGKTLLATSPSTGTVYVFDATSLAQRAIIPVGKAPKGVKVTPDGRFAYVSNQGSADISVIDLNSLKNIGEIKVEKGPHNVRFTKDGALAYVTLQGGAGIGVIDTKTKLMTKVIAVPGITGPHNLDLSSDEKTAYVRDFVHNVAILDLTTEQVIKVIKVGNGHGGIDIDPAGRFVATAAIGDSVVTIIDPKSYAVQTIDVGKGPHGIRSSRDSQWIYVTLTGENKIAVINTKTMKVEKKIPVDKFPFWISVLGNP